MAEKKKDKKPLFGRKVTHRYERIKGKKRLRRCLAEKLHRYERHAEAHEFVPAVIHTVRRVLSGGGSESQWTSVEVRLAQALAKLPDAKKHLAAALKVHDELPRELKRRAFAGALLDRDLKQGIEASELAGILDRAVKQTNRAVVDLAFPGFVKDHPKGGSCCCDGEQNPPPPPPGPPPNPYELTFTKLYCVDESDPEWFGSDEPYVVFGVITEEMAEAGTAAFATHTPVYEDVDDGDTRPSSGDENLRLFGFTGPRAIDSSFLMTGTCFENDLGDPSDTTAKVRTALTTIATTAAGAGGVAGWVVAGVAVLGIGVSYLVDLIGADDQIGSSLALSFTEAEADARTAAVNPVILDPLHFDGGDDDGIYDVYLKLRRA
jgi:hypothetical protein